MPSEFEFVRDGYIMKVSADVHVHLVEVCTERYVNQKVVE